MIVKNKENSIITIMSREEAGAISPCSKIPSIMENGYSRKEAETILSIMAHGMTMEEAIKTHKENVAWVKN